MRFEDRFAKAARKAEHRVDRRSRVNRKLDIEKEIVQMNEDHDDNVRELIAILQDFGVD